MLPELHTALGIGLLTGAGATATGLVLSKSLRQFWTKNFEDSYLRDVLPFDHIAEDQQTIFCKNGTICRVMNLRGILGEALSRDQEAMLFHKRRKWLMELAEKGCAFKVITLREEISRQVPNTYTEGTLRAIEDRWSKNFEKTYLNSHYLVFTESPSKFEMSQSLKSLLERKNPEQVQANIARLAENFEISQDSLYEFGPRTLGNEGQGASPLLSFWANLIHGERTEIRPLHTHISDQLVGAEISFDTRRGRIHWNFGDREQVGAIISLNKWDEDSSPLLMKDMNALPGRFMLLQMLQGMPKGKALRYLKDQREQNSRSIKALNQYQAAEERVSAGDSALYSYQCSLMLLADTEEDLKGLIQAARQIFRNYWIVCILEKSAIEFVWRSFYPTYDEMLRETKPMAHNLAHLMNFPQESKGLERSDWGEGPIRLFKTAAGTAYSLQLHESEEKEALANSVVIAPAGSGKTTLFEHLIGGALRHTDLRAYIFDRFNGTRIFTQSTGGNYVDFTNSCNPVALNPLLGEDSPQERAFLTEFFQLLAGEKSEAHQREAEQAVGLLFKAPLKKRVLSKLHPSLFNTHSLLHRQLKPWVGTGIYSHWFNGEQDGQAFDALNFEDNRLVSFEMTEIQSKPETSAAVTHYIMHRIRCIIRQQALPHLIFIDETAPMLQNALFRGYVEVLFKEHRKLRGSINVCFQNAGDLIRTGIAETILNQCPTRFLFPNAAANREDYSLFNLTEAEWSYIKGESRLSRTLQRSVLVKRQSANGMNESVILNLDLSPLGPYLKLYRSGSESVKLVQQLQQQWGSAWIDSYLTAS